MWLARCETGFTSAHKADVHSRHYGRDVDVLERVQVGARVAGVRVQLDADRRPAEVALYTPREWLTRVQASAAQLKRVECLHWWRTPVQGPSEQSHACFRLHTSH